MVLLAHVMAIYVALRLLFEGISWIGRKLQSGATIASDLCICVDNLRGQKGDDLSGALAGQVMLILLYTHRTGFCYQSAMEHVTLFYHAIVVLFINTIIVNLCGEQLNRARRNFQGAGGLVVCLLIVLLGLVLLALWVFLIIVFIMLCVSYFNSNNHCKKHSPYNEFFMAFVVWGVFSYIISRILIGCIGTFTIAKIDAKENTRPALPLILEEGFSGPQIQPHSIPVHNVNRSDETSNSL
jgi:hypothetical protein